MSDFMECSCESSEKSNIIEVLQDLNNCFDTTYTLIITVIQIYWKRAHSVNEELTKENEHTQPPPPCNRLIQNLFHTKRIK